MNYSPFWCALFFTAITIGSVQAQTPGVPETSTNNNTAATAMPITLPAKIKGNIFPAADVDYYSFTAAADSRVFATAVTAFYSLNSDSKITLYAANGTTIVESDSDDGTFSATSGSIAGAVLPTTGTYYLKVDPQDVTTTTIRNYDLYVNVQAGNPVPETEPNDAISGADALPASGFVSGAKSTTTDIDYYSISLTAGQTVFLSLDLNPERNAVSWNGRLLFGLFGDANDQLLVTDDPGTADNQPSEAFVFTVKNSGTYYIRVDAGTAIGDPTYTYTLSARTFNATTGYVNYASTDVPKTIGPGTGSVTSTLTIPGGNKRIRDISVRLQLTHALMADIDAVLTTPTGETIKLFSDVGSTTTGGYQIMNIVLNDNNALPVNSYFLIQNNIGYQPEPDSKLDVLYNRNAAGTWTLTLFDDGANTSGGTLSAWSIDILEQPAPPAPASIIVSENFETGNGGFTHSGTADEWEYGTPATGATFTSSPPPIIAFTTANSGTKCWKTDLDNTYNNSSDQVLQSPVYNLSAASGVITLSYAMKFQMENASFDQLIVTAEEEGGSGLVLTLFTWLGGTQTTSVGNPIQYMGISGGWATYYADISAFAGKRFRFKVKVTTDDTVPFAGVGIDDVQVYSSPTILPLNSNQLQGTYSNTGNKLEWLVGCGSNPSATIALERSKNGVSFETINTQTATAARCASSFYYTDTYTGPGGSYYRIRVLTPDGKVTSTNVIYIRSTPAGLQLLSIAPNPATGEYAHLQITVASAGKVTAAILDAKGVLLSKTTLSLTAGINSTSLPIGKLNGGLYYVKLTDEQGLEQMQLMVKQ